MNELSKEKATLFERLKHIDEDGTEYWSARELAPHLGYKRWESFPEVVEKARRACISTVGTTKNDFRDVTKIVKAGILEKPISDIQLTRYACYLVAQNGDSRKKEIAQAQTYFAIQTRYAEIQQTKEYQNLTGEETKRLYLREQLRKYNSKLADAAHNAGVITSLEYAVFQNFGYRGMYNGLDAKAIHKKKNLKKNQNILDHMGSTELAANLFRSTQAEEKIRKEQIRGKNNANLAHYQVGKEVREAIKRIGGTMPEELPPAESIKKVESKRKKLLKESNKKLKEK